MKKSEEELIDFGGEPDEVFFERSVHGEMEQTPKRGGKKMNCQKCELPEGAVFKAATPLFSEKTMPEPMTKSHLPPHGKFGKLIVSKGKLRFVREDTNEVLEVLPNHPVIIPPGQFHHIELCGPVEFKVEFYQVPGVEEKPCCCEADKEPLRPGEAYLDDAYLVTK